MNKNYFKIKEKKQENKKYRIILCDLLLLIEHCIKYNFPYCLFKDLYLDIENIIYENEKIIKDLESDL